jgi:hypothetical protein
MGKMTKHTNLSFIQKSIEKHGNKYDYSLVNYINNRTKVRIICPLHGEFEQNPYDHSTGIGCLKCSGKFKFTNEIFIKKSIEKHGNKYDYSLVEYINSVKKVKILCPIHGEFNQSPNCHMGGKGCKKM